MLAVDFQCWYDVMTFEFAFCSIQHLQLSDGNSNNNNHNSNKSRRIAASSPSGHFFSFFHIHVFKSLTDLFRWTDPPVTDI